MIRALLDDDCSRFCMLGAYPGYVLGIAAFGTGTHVLTGVWDGTSIGHPEQNGFRVVVQNGSHGPFLGTGWPPAGATVPTYYDLAVPQPAPISGIYEHLITAPSDTDDPRLIYLPYRARTDPATSNPLTCILRWQNTRGVFGLPDGDWDTDPFLTVSSAYFWGTGSFAEGRNNSGPFASFTSYGLFDPTIAGDAVRAVIWDADWFGFAPPPPGLEYFASTWTLDTPVLSNHAVIGCANDTSGDTLSGIWACGTRKALHHDLDPGRTAAWAGCIFTPDLGGPPAGHLLDLDEASGIYASALNHLYFYTEDSIFAVGWKQAVEGGDKTPMLQHFHGGSWNDISSSLPAWDFSVTGPVNCDVMRIVERGSPTPDRNWLVVGWVDAPDCAGAARRPIAWIFHEDDATGNLSGFFWWGLDTGTLQLGYTDAAMLAGAQDVADGFRGLMTAGQSCGQWATWESVDPSRGFAANWYAGQVE